jgi:hypothetical protein
MKDYLKLDDFTKSCLVAAIQGYTTKGDSPEVVSKKAVELVRCLAKELNYDGDIVSIESMNKIEKLEQKIGRKLNRDEKYYAGEALDSGTSIDEIIHYNPHFLDGQPN